MINYNEQVPQHVAFQINEMAEALDNNTRALQVLADLIDGCRHPVQLDGLAFLVQPILNDNRAIIDKLHELGFPKHALGLD